MRLPYQSSTSLSHLFLLVMAWGSEVRGQPCPSGQIAHRDDRVTKCCLPAYCQPNYSLMYCTQNGTSDTCRRCPSTYGLYKRTSSFAVEPCHLLLVVGGVGQDKCEAREESAAAYEDKKNCYCNMEQGFHYYEPQYPMGPTSYCQPIPKECLPGNQPNQIGKCEPCPPNTLQNTTGFQLCRPQINCTALRLETRIPGSASQEAVCAEPPPSPSSSSSLPILPTTTSVSPSVKSTTLFPSDASVRNVVSSDNAAHLVVMLVMGLVVLIVCVLLAAFMLRRRRFVRLWKGMCVGDDAERRQSGSQLQLSHRDNDNTSDNSCYTCANSCLTSSSKTSSSAPKSAGGSVCEGKGGACPLPMLEAYMNMKGTCGGDSLPSVPSEPFYNSIGLDPRPVKGSGDSLPAYNNTNAYCTSAARPDLPTARVHLLPGGEGEEEEGKGTHYAQSQRADRGKDHSDDFSETDPLLPPHSQNGSSGSPTPLTTPTPPLKGILRNNGSKEPQRGGGEGGGEGGGGGNRPKLSLLLEEGCGVGSADPQNPNLPHLSQLVSAPQPPAHPPLHHQQLQQQQAPPLPDHAGPELLPHYGPQGSPVAARFVPTSLAGQQPLNPSLVQMEELKPVPLSPGPGGGTTPTSPTSPTSPGGAGPRGQDGSQSPACIVPSQHVVATGAANTSAPRHDDNVPVAGAALAVQKDSGEPSGRQDSTGVKSVMYSDSTTPHKAVSEETLRKQAACGDDTMHKSVCGSSGLGDSLDFSSPLELPPEEEGGASRTPYRRSNSEASRSVSPVHQLPPSRSNSTPEEKHRPFAVVKPMQSDQSLNTMSDSHDRLSELTQQFDAVGRHFPLTSLASHTPHQQTCEGGCGSSEGRRAGSADSASEEEGEGGRWKGGEQTSAVLQGGGGDRDRDGGRGADRQDSRGSEN